jgi:hypothetical protein
MGGTFAAARKVPDPSGFLPSFFGMAAIPRKQAGGRRRASVW